MAAPTEPQTRREALIEAFAMQAHHLWAGWMMSVLQDSEKRPDGSLVLSAERVQRWQRLIATPFTALMFDEQLSYEDDAEKFLLLLRMAGMEV